MNINFRSATFLMAGVILLAGGFFVNSDNISFLYKAGYCDRNYQTNDKKTECWYQLLSNALQKGGVPSVMEKFSMLYERYPVISSAGACHRAAHNIGDMIYFKTYLNTHDFSAINFPPETTFCTFGVFHGFFEHLFQDAPTSGFITASCDYFEGRFAESISTIREQCYHGAGHGLMLAASEHVLNREWGRPGAFAQKPLEDCDALPELTQDELEQCRQGIFTVLADWMATGQYGLSFDSKQPFSFCERLSERFQEMCYRQIGDRFYGAQNMTISELATSVSEIDDMELRILTFRVAMLGIVSRTIQTGSYLTLIPVCSEIPSELFVACIQSFPHAIFNAGFAEDQFPLALHICSSNEVALQNTEDACFRMIALQLRRFYTLDETERFCKKFPERYKPICRDPVLQNIKSAPHVMRN